MGSSAYTVSAMTAVTSPMPVAGMRNPNSAMEGMVYAKLTRASVGLAARFRRAMIVPTASPQNARQPDGDKRQADMLEQQVEEPKAFVGEQ